MGIARRFLATALAVMIASCMGATAAFADTSEVSGVNLTLSADKAGYVSGDAAEFTWKLENGTDEPLADVQMKLSLPAGMVAADGAELEFPFDDVAAGETAQGTVKALVPDTSLSSALSSTGDPLSDLPVGAILAALAALACLIVVAARKGDVFRGPLCALLALALVAGMCPAVSLAEPAYADEQKSVSLSAKQAVTVNGAEATATLDATFRASIEGNQVSFYLTYDEYVKNPDDFKAYWVADGALLDQPATPLSYVGEFDGWYADLECAQPFDFAAPVTEDVVLVAKWALDETDSDSDGLTDGIEDYLGTDPAKADTDGDGLPDGVEVSGTATSPLKVDTDGNGVSDFDEDFDLDGAANGRELSLGTDPSNSDTDGDDLADGREADELGTDPLKADTDGDVADDGWEVFYGSDPLKFDSAITATAGSDEATADDPVVASVSLGLSGSQLSTLDVRRVNPIDNHLVSASIPGYMGSAYDFSVEGSFDEATITFAFDEATFGAPDEDFKPAIFYVNEETGTLDKLPNQAISGNKVSATTTHFSTYILLNEVPFDKVWAADIKLPVSGNDESTRTDIVFCIDYSMSMDDNDPHYLRLDVTEEFIDKLREGFDQVGVVKFINPATTVCELTGDMSAAKEAVRGIVNDDGKTDGVSGTNGSAGLLEALRVIESSTAPNKYIVFLTDGQDTYPRNDTQLIRNYVEVMNEAENNKVAIYTIGLGDNVSKDRLKSLADFTGGEYYNAKAGLDLDDVYSWIEHDTVDLVADSNKDGIPDYYSTLIKNGTLVLSNGSRELVGIDFNYDRNGNTSNDYDGDGVVNGKEIELVVNQEKGSVYLKRNSDPISNETVQAGGSASSLRAVFDGTAAARLTSDTHYFYPKEVNNWQSGLLSYMDPILSQVFGTNKDEVFRSTLQEYIETYSYNLDEIEGQCQLRVAYGVLDVMRGALVGQIDQAESTLKLLEDVNDTMALISEGTKDADEIMSRFSGIYERFTAAYPNVPLRAYSISVSQKAKKALGTTNNAGNILNGAGVLVDGLSTISNCASISRDNAAYSLSYDLLCQLERSAEDQSMRDAATFVRNVLAEKYAAAVSKIVLEVGSESAVVVLEAFAVKKPFLKSVNSVTLCIAAIDILLGAGDAYRQMFELFTYHDLCTAYAARFNGVTSLSGGYRVSGKGEDVSSRNYLTNVAQLRILGERQLVECCKTDGAWGGVKAFFGSKVEYEDSLGRQVEKIRIDAGDAGLKLGI